MRYICRRVGHALLVLFGVSFLTFLLAAAAPGRFADELRVDPRISPQTIAAMQVRYGLDDNAAEQYARWLLSVSRGELGFSIAYNRPVGGLVWPRARNTLLLTVPSTLLLWLIAIPLGVWSAGRSGEWVDWLIGGTLTTVLAIPEILLSLLLLLFAVRTGLFPAGGMTSLNFDTLAPWAKAQDAISHFILPAAALALTSLPVLVRHVRASVLDTINAPFIWAARASGVPERRLLFRHALRTAANPLISLFGLSFAGLLSASLVTEVVMSWPGLGPLLLDAVASRDVHVVAAVVTCSTLLLIAGNLLVDGMLYLADPRIRPERA